MVAASDVPSIAIDLRSISSLPLPVSTTASFHANAASILNSQQRLNSPFYRSDVVRKLVTENSNTLVVYSAKCLTIALGTYDPHVAYEILSNRLLASVDSGK